MCVKGCEIRGGEAGCNGVKIEARRFTQVLICIDLT